MNTEWLGIIITSLIAAISLFMAWKTNATLKSIKTFEYQHSIYNDVIEQLSKADVGINCDYVKFTTACYKARLFLPKSVGTVLLQINNKVRLREVAIKESNCKQISKLNDEIHDLTEIVITNMANTINRHSKFE